jgi:hypothetical protein
MRPPPMRQRDLSTPFCNLYVSATPNDGHEKQQEDRDDGDRIRRQLRALHHQNCPGTHDADHCNQEGTEKQGPYSPPR